MKAFEMMFPQEEETSKFPADHQAAIMTLREKYERYKEGCPFKPGDIVTPFIGAYILGELHPHIVVEVFDAPIRPLNTEPSSPAFHAVFDMRVIGFSKNGVICAWASESWQFVPYTPDMEKLAKEAASKD